MTYLQSPELIFLWETRGRGQRYRYPTDLYNFFFWIEWIFLQQFSSGVLGEMTITVLMAQYQGKKTRGVCHFSASVAVLQTMVFT